MKFLLGGFGHFYGLYINFTVIVKNVDSELKF